ncbi:MAG: aldehyde dehydrogenase family protein [candidate division FCPU426 bacterium]
MTGASVNPAEIYSRQHTFFRTGRTWPVAFRREHLVRLGRALIAHEPELLAALHHDLGKSEIEAFASELGLVAREVSLAIKRLPAWIKPIRKPTPWLNWPAKSFQLPEPRGVVLIMGPWNYPVQLLLLPLVGALAAGCCAVVKPSEFTPAASEVLQRLIRDIYPPEYCQVVTGTGQEAAALLDLPWDHIFFTGSTRVGRLVMQAAAKHLTSITLELGGKNPCIVLADTPLEIAAERIAWGKFLNAGQTCGAPDHCYIQRQVLGPFTEALKRVLTRFYGADPRQSPDFGRIVNIAHFDRLLGYLSQGRVLAGGQVDRGSRYVAPTLMADVPENAPLMQEEIFGPILPLLPFDDLDALLGILRDRPNPLAAYVFTRDAASQIKALQHLRAGTMALNDTMSQITSSHLPLGGVGESGQGRYHGQASFACFSHYKSVLAKGYIWNNRMKYPPYTVPLKWLKKFYAWLM